MTAGSEGILKEARDRARDRIRADLEKAETEDVRQVLRFIQGHLFDAGFNINMIQRELNPKRQTFRRFQAQVGDSPKRYTDHCKRRTAEWLLSSTNIELWQISDLLGFSTETNFGQAFKGWTGKTPGTLRDEDSKTPTRQVADDLEMLKLWFRAGVGALEEEEIEKLCGWLEAHTGKQFHVTKLDAANLVAEVILEFVDEYPFETQVEIVESVIFYGPPVLFDLLCNQIIPESRKNRQRGVEMAQLAIVHLEATADHLEDVSVTGLRAVAQARLGNALRLAGDWEEAEKAIRRALGAWETPQEMSDFQLRAECLLIEGSLRYQQRRYEESLTSLQQAIGLGRAQGSSLVLCQALLQASTLYVYLDNIEAAVPLLRETLRHARKLKDFGVEGSAWHNLAVAEIRLKNIESATVALENARSACHSNDHINRYKIDWIEGRLMYERGRLSDADVMISQARIAFADRDMIDEAACAALDLAVMRHQSGRHTEALSLAAEAIPIFEALHGDMEAQAALYVLRNALNSNEVSLQALEYTRDVMQKIQHHPQPFSRRTPTDLEEVSEIAAEEA